MCPCLILSNHSDSHGQILGAFPSIRKLTVMDGGDQQSLPSVDELKKAGLDGIPI